MGGTVKSDTFVNSAGTGAPNFPFGLTTSGGNPYGATYTSDDGATPTATVIDYNNSVYDPFNIVSPGAGTWTCTPTITGLYLIYANFYAGSSAAQKYLKVTVNGSQILYALGTAVSPFASSISVLSTYPLTAGDDIQVLTDFSAPLQTLVGQNTFSIVLLKI